MVDGGGSHLWSTLNSDFASLLPSTNKKPLFRSEAAFARASSASIAKNHSRPWDGLFTSNAGSNETTSNIPIASYPAWSTGQPSGKNAATRPNGSPNRKSSLNKEVGVPPSDVLSTLLGPRQKFGGLPFLESKSSPRMLTQQPLFWGKSDAIAAESSYFTNMRPATTIGGPALLQERHGLPRLSKTCNGVLPKPVVHDFSFTEEPPLVTQVLQYKHKHAAEDVRFSTSTMPISAGTSISAVPRAALGPIGVDSPDAPVENLLINLKRERELLLQRAQDEDVRLAATEAKARADVRWEMGVTQQVQHKLDMQKQEESLTELKTALKERDETIQALLARIEVLETRVSGDASDERISRLETLLDCAESRISDLTEQLACFLHETFSTDVPAPQSETAIAESFLDDRPVTLVEQRKHVAVGSPAVGSPAVGSPALGSPTFEEPKAPKPNSGLQPYSYKDRIGGAQGQRRDAERLASTTASTSTDMEFHKGGCIMNVETIRPRLRTVLHPDSAAATSLTSGAVNSGDTARRSRCSVATALRANPFSYVDSDKGVSTDSGVGAAPVKRNSRSKFYHESTKSGDPLSSQHTTLRCGAKLKTRLSDSFEWDTEPAVGPVLVKDTQEDRSNEIPSRTHPGLGDICVQQRYFDVNHFGNGTNKSTGEATVLWTSRNTNSPASTATGPPAWDFASVDLDAKSKPTRKKEKKRAETVTKSELAVNLWSHNSCNHINALSQSGTKVLEHCHTATQGSSEPVRTSFPKATNQNCLAIDNNPLNSTSLDENLLNKYSVNRRDNSPERTAATLVVERLSTTDDGTLNYRWPGDSGSEEPNKAESPDEAESPNEAKSPNETESPNEAESPNEGECKANKPFKFYCTSNVNEQRATQLEGTEKRHFPSSSSESLQRFSLVQMNPIRHPSGSDTSLETSSIQVTRTLASPQINRCFIHTGTTSGVFTDESALHPVSFPEDPPPVVAADISEREKPGIRSLRTRRRLPKNKLKRLGKTKPPSAKAATKRPLPTGVDSGTDVHIVAEKSYRSNAEFDTQSNGSGNSIEIVGNLNTNKLLDISGADVRIASDRSSEPTETATST